METPPRDLLELLHQRWLETQPTIPQKPETGTDHGERFQLFLRQQVSEFVNWCREELKKNLPVGVDHRGQVMSLTFQDMSTIPIVHIAAGELPQMGNTGPAAYISSPRTTQSGIAPSRAWGVTGEK